MRIFLIILSLAWEPFIARCVTPQDALMFYIVSDQAIAGGRYINTPDCPNVGYITNTPNMVITHLESVSTNAIPVVTEDRSGRMSAKTNCAIVIQLAKGDAKLFTQLTEQKVGHRLLICLGDRPLIAPRINSPIENGEFEITLAEDRNIGSVLAVLRKFVRH